MWWYVLAIVIGLVAICLVWGYLHLRHSQRVAAEAISNVSLGDIDPLRQECENVFREAFGESLSLDHYEESTRVLSDRLDNVESLKNAFAKPDFYWYFVLPTGAFLGELLRVHVEGEWHPSEEGGLELHVPVASEFAVTYPFDKILKHVIMGDKGDIQAYFMSARQLEQALEQTNEA